MFLFLHTVNIWRRKHREGGEEKEKRKAIETDFKRKASKSEGRKNKQKFRTT
jgi:spore maturation protein CgeB